MIFHEFSLFFFYVFLFFVWQIKCNWLWFPIRVIYVLTCSSIFLMIFYDVWELTLTNFWCSHDVIEYHDFHEFSWFFMIFHVFSLFFMIFFVLQFQNIIMINKIHNIWTMINCTMLFAQCYLHNLICTMLNCTMLNCTMLNGIMLFAKCYLHNLKFGQC